MHEKLDLLLYRARSFSLTNLATTKKDYRTHGIISCTRGRVNIYQHTWRNSCMHDLENPAHVLFRLNSHHILLFLKYSLSIQCSTGSTCGLRLIQFRFQFELEVLIIYVKGFRGFKIVRFVNPNEIFFDCLKFIHSLMKC